jgi:hypothetical protein
VVPAVGAQRAQERLVREVGPRERARVGERVVVGAVREDARARGEVEPGARDMRRPEAVELAEDLRERAEVGRICAIASDTAWCAMRSGADRRTSRARSRCGRCCTS